MRDFNVMTRRNPTDVLGGFPTRMPKSPARSTDVRTRDRTGRQRKRDGGCTCEGTAEPLLGYLVVVRASRDDAASVPAAFAEPIATREIAGQP